MTRFFAAIAALAVVLLVAVPGASAGAGLAPQKQGWWSTAGGSASAPDAPADGLFVDGSAANPLAVSALRYQIPTGVTADTLTLTVASGSVTVSGSGVKVCPLVGDRDFNPTQGGAMANAPKWNCANAAPGAADAAGSKYTFSVGHMVTGDVLAIAIVPAGQRDRIAFARPDVSSLTVSYPATSQYNPPDTTTTDPTPLAAPSADFSAPSGSIDAPVSESLRDVTALDTQTAAPESRSATAPSVDASAPAPAPSGGPASALIGAVAIVAFAVATAWRGRRTLSDIFGATSSGA